MMSYRFARWGLIVSFLLVVAWLCLAGMNFLIAIFVLVVYLGVEALIMARCTAEAGLLMTEGSFTPLDVLGLAMPKGILGRSNLTAMVWVDGLFTRDLRGLTLTAMLDGQHLAPALGLPRRQLIITFVVAFVASLIIAATIQLWLPYRQGAVTLYPYAYQHASVQFFRENTPIILGDVPYNPQAPVFFVLGALMTFFLVIMRTRFAWWPFHPLGYAMCVSWSVVTYWFSMLVAWVCKSLTVRYGGLPLYTRARPFFLGLVAGELLMAVIWTLASLLWHLPTPLIPFD